MSLMVYGALKKYKPKKEPYIEKKKKTFNKCR